MRKITGLIACLLCSGISNAAPIVTYDLVTSYATGILDLDVGGSIYNVDFVDASYDSVYSSSSPVFLGDFAGASAAADAIMNTLNSELSVPEINEFPNEILWVAYAEIGGDFQAAQTGHNLSADPWQRFTNFQGNRSVDYGPWYFAKFSAAVPEPSTLILLGFGLLGLGLRRRKLAN